MSNSPWNAYGRLPQKPAARAEVDRKDPVAGVLNEVARGREQVERYLDGLLKEFNAIRSGSAGYRQIISDALAPSSRPETIEERLARLAAKAQTRRTGRPPNTSSR